MEAGSFPPLPPFWNVGNKGGRSCRSPLFFILDQDPLALLQDLNVVLPVGLDLRPDATWPILPPPLLSSG